jgi:hypothetical protein
VRPSACFFSSRPTYNGVKFRIGVSILKVVWKILFISHTLLGSQDSSVGVVTRLLAG